MIQIRSQTEQDRPFNLLAWGHWFALGNLVLAALLSLFYIVNGPTPETIIGWFYLLSSWIGHFAFLSLACFIVTIFPFITLFPNKKYIRGFAAIVATLLQMLLFLDVLAYQGLGYHLSSVSIGQLKEVEDIYTTAIGDYYWLLLLSVLFALLCYQFLISNFTWKRIYRLQAWQYKNLLARILLVFFISSHLIHLWADATFNTDVAKQTNLFPLSYPLTAKTLLAKYDLIDLDEYQVTRYQSAQVNSNQYTTAPLNPFQCSITDNTALNIILIDGNEYNKVSAWLSRYNVRFKTTNQLYIATDLDTLMYNFNTGLPGLYRDLPNKQERQINTIFNADKISVSLYDGEFDLDKKYRASENKQAFVFLPDVNGPFAAAKAILIGFEMESNQTITPQNIIASFINQHLNCPSFVKNNLIDEPISNLNDTYLFTNYSNEHLSLIYKDKSMVFYQGRLTDTKTLSNKQSVEEYLDLNVLKRGVEKITKYRARSTIESEQ